MSNDLSANMRRSRMAAQEEERRAKGKQVRENLLALRSDSFEAMTSLLDDFAKTQGYLKQRMVEFAENLGMHEFASYYRIHSQAWDGRHN